MSGAQNSILTALERLPPETRVEMADKMQSLVEHPGWAVHSKLLDDLVGSYRSLLERPGVHEHTEYVSMHHGLLAVLKAKAIPDAVLESGTRANDQLRQTVAAMEHA